MLKIVRTPKFVRARGDMAHGGVMAARRNAKADVGLGEAVGQLLR